MYIVCLACALGLLGLHSSPTGNQEKGGFIENVNLFFSFFELKVIKRGK